MLVLTRKQQEKIHVGQDITITVVRIKGNTVRVGIEAPRDVRVMRGEIHANEPLVTDSVPSTAGTEQPDGGKTQSDVGDREQNDKPPAPWQRIRNERRGPLPAPSCVTWSARPPRSESVPIHAV